MSSDDTQVLEFELGTEKYCVDIDAIAEIVDVGDLTPVPNSPAHVEGVMDLRGRTTSIVNPKQVLGIEGNGDRKRIVVFDPDRREENDATGWLVDEVYQVVRIDGDDVDDPPTDDEHLRGVVKRDDEFVMWLDTHLVEA